MNLEKIIEYYELNGKLPQNINDLTDEIICGLLEYEIDFVNELKASRMNLLIAQTLLELDIEEFIIFIDYVKNNINLYDKFVSRYFDKTGVIPEDIKFKSLKLDTRRKIIKKEPSYIAELSNSEKNYFYFRRALCFTEEEILDFISYFPSSSYEDYSCSLLVCNNLSYFKKLSLDIKKNINLNAYVESSLDYKELSKEELVVIIEKLKEGNYNILKKLYDKKFLDFLDKEQVLYFKTKWYEKCYNTDEKTRVLKIFEEEEFNYIFVKEPLSIIYAPIEYRTDERWKKAFDDALKTNFSRVNHTFWSLFPKHLLDPEKIDRIIDTHAYALDYIELDSLDDDKFWETIEKKATVANSQVKLFKEKFKPEKMDIVLKCFKISSLLASYKPLLDEINDNNVGVILTICPEVIDFLPLNQNLVYSFCLYDPDFVRKLFVPNLNQYLDRFLLELFVAKANNVRLSEIPQEFLTEELVLLALQRSDKAVSKLSAKNKTQMMFDVVSKWDKKDTSLFDSFKDKLAIIKKQQNEIDKYFKLKNTVIKNLPILIKYFEDSNISISKFCIENKIDEKLFRSLINEVGKLEEEIKTNYEQLTNVHKKEGWNYISDTINFIDKSIKNGVKSPEKDEIIKFNSVLYYIYCSMDVDRLLDGLKSVNNRYLCNYVRKQLKIENPSIKDFDNIEIEYKSKHLSKEEKEQIKIFLKDHKIPMDTKMAMQIFYLCRDGHINILKKYKPIHSYILDDNTRESISRKVQKIRMQRVIIERLDTKIMSIREEIEGVIKR